MDYYSVSFSSSRTKIMPHLEIMFVLHELSRRFSRKQ